MSGLSIRSVSNASSGALERGPQAKAITAKERSGETRRWEVCPG